MNAKERLLRTGMSHAFATLVLNDHAHELAEKQRTEMRAPGSSYDASRWNRCVNMTADLIDPEVQK